MTTSIDDLPANAFLRLPQVIAVVGLKRSTIYDLISRRRFPPQHKITAHAAGWRVHEVRRWLADPAGWEALHSA